MADALKAKVANLISSWDRRYGKIERPPVVPPKKSRSVREANIVVKQANKYCIERQGINESHDLFQHQQHLTGACGASLAHPTSETLPPYDQFDVRV